MQINPVVTRDIRYETTIYNHFRGVDFSVDASLVDKDRSPFAPNLIADIGGVPEKRPGWRVLHTVESPINSMFVGEISGSKCTLVHGGTKLYKITDTTVEVLKSDLKNSKSIGFFMKDRENNSKAYLITGGDFVYYDGKTAGNIDDIAYIPTTIISRNPTGGGTVYEPVNLLQPKQKNSFLGNETEKTYQLTSNNIESVVSVEVTQSDGTTKTLATSEYTVNLTNGTVTFNTTYKPPITGQDNVIITFKKTVSGYADRIKQCCIVSSYGVGGSNRIFLSGNPNYKAYDWYSELYDPTYFPDTGYAVVGSPDTAIMGYAKLGKYLLIIKEDSHQDSTVFQRWGSMNSDGTVTFSLEQGISGIGAISKRSFATLIDEPLFLTRRGVYAITSNNITAERTMRNRSFFIDSVLTKESGLENAIAVEWNGFYIIGINNRAYILNSRDKSYKSRVDAVSDYFYECFHWENIPANCFLPVGNELYFGTEQGQICKFNTDINNAEKYNDNGEPIIAYWATKNDDDNLPQFYKTMTKKGSFVTIKPYSRSSASCCFRKDNEAERELRYDTMDILDWDYIDFDRFSFNTNDGPKEIYFKKKVKKYKRGQIIIRNNKLNEGFGIFQIVKTFTVGSYAKK